jgi:hypothetical protein
MGSKLLTGILATAAGLYALNYLGTKRGALKDEVRRSMPGDDLIPNAAIETTHGITISAPAEAIWPWLVQVGYHRGGWYTDSWLDEFLFEYFFKPIAPADKKPEYKPSAIRILPDYQSLQVGDQVPDGPPGTVYYVVNEMELNSHLVLYSDTYDRVVIPGFLRSRSAEPIIEFSWSFVINEKRPGTSRLIVRARINSRSRLIGSLLWPFLLMGEAVFPSLMLNGFKQRAERSVPVNLE